jgi:hypothetical protein
VHHLHWEPHALSEVQKAQEVTLSGQLLRMLEVQHDRASRNIVTLDESWLYLTKDHKFILLPQGEKVRERQHHTI